MGWLDRKARRRARKKFRVRCLYICDMCDKPILNPFNLGDDLLVIDPSKGYYPWPNGMPIALRGLSHRQPRWTAHYACWKAERDAIREAKEAKKARFLHKVDRVYEMIAQKPKRGYWTKEKCCNKSKYDRTVVLRAIKLLVKNEHLKKREGGYLPRH